MTIAAPRSGPLASLGEYFTFRRALDVHGKLAPPARKSIAGALSLGRQRADAADALWANGHAAEALRLAIESLESSAAAAREYSAGIGVPITGGAAPARAVAPAPSVQRTSDVDRAPDAASDSDAERASRAESAPDGEPASDAGSASETGSTSRTEPASETKSASETVPASDAALTPDLAADREVAAADVVPAFAAPDATAVRASALRARGMSRARIDAIEAALSAARGATLPVLDADVSPTHAELFRRVLDAQRALDRALSTAGLERREIQFARAARIGGAALLATVIVAGIAIATHTPEGVTVEASAVWAEAPAFGGDTVLDGRADTFWLLPDSSTGWVEARIQPPQRVEHVTVLNSHNAPHGDRATRDYRIEIYAGGRVARSIDGSFPYSTSPEPVTHDVGIDDVQRIRFVVRSHHRTGAGLAEISWD